MRGQGLIAAQRYAGAAAEFQKILDHRDIMGADPIGVLAHLQIVRAFALPGDKTRTKAAYEAFPRTLEKRRPRYPDLEKCLSRVREAVVIAL